MPTLKKRWPHHYRACFASTNCQTPCTPRVPLQQSDVSRGIPWVCVSTLLQIGWLPPAYVPSSTVTEIRCLVIKTDTALVASGCGQDTCVQSFFQCCLLFFREETHGIHDVCGCIRHRRASVRGAQPGTEAKKKAKQLLATHASRSKNCHAPRNPES